ncbi:hypothetical protein [Campylobacter ureolyticus]|uniref:hypothetical protein n=1 Tax=Campylobacter ureolyticus TaxID=827 RepID=UPI0022B46BD2|nr:hypothetical protein [Campylobacter ureolyticus]MCZ6112119.1 hypothetical protein [Campylobacter ureolyticus]MCZ6169631.1 hypothetical protein [Campylobacter ureolyticus]MDK8323852.1 hypothetical protein [Campylobacter ureolyticus]
MENKKEKTELICEKIKEVILENDNSILQKDLVKESLIRIKNIDESIGRRTVIFVLEQYQNKMWYVNKFYKNSKYFSLINEREKISQDEILNEDFFEFSKNKKNRIKALMILKECFKFKPTITKTLLIQNYHANLNIFFDEIKITKENAFYLIKNVFYPYLECFDFGNLIEYKFFNIHLLNLYLKDGYIYKDEFEKYEKIYNEIEELHKKTDFSKFKYIK